MKDYVQNAASIDNPDQIIYFYSGKSGSTCYKYDVALFWIVSAFGG